MFCLKQCAGAAMPRVSFRYELQENTSFSADLSDGLLRLFDRTFSMRLPPPSGECEKPFVGGPVVDGVEMFPSPPVRCAFLKSLRHWTVQKSLLPSIVG